MMTQEIRTEWEVKIRQRHLEVVEGNEDTMASFPLIKWPKSGAVVRLRAHRSENPGTQGLIPYVCVCLMFCFFNNNNLIYVWITKTSIDFSNLLFFFVFFLNWHYYCITVFFFFCVVIFRQLFGNHQRPGCWNVHAVFSVLPTFLFLHLALC